MSSFQVHPKIQQPECRDHAMANDAVGCQVGQSIAPEEFRRAMGSFASGVTVVTAAHDGELAGLTANAFSSVSLQPPMVLVCVGRDSQSERIIRAAGLFAVHILAADQEEVAERFARSSGTAKFGLSDWSPGPSGTPLMDRYLSRLLCRLSATHEGGDHLIFVGEVESLGIRPDLTVPLTYFQGRMGALRPHLASVDSF